jgi:hypothetical protein
VSEIERPSRDIERRPRHVIVPAAEARQGERYASDDLYAEARAEDEFDANFDDEAGGDWSHLKPVLKRHKVTLSCLALIVISLIFKAVFLSHYYFQQDDFDVFDVALHSKFSWGFLTHDDVGHLFPGVYALGWVQARYALYSWAAGAAVILVMIAGSSLAAWRLLRTLLGNRPAILIPLTFYVISPLAFSVDYWWIAAVEAIPLQIAIFMTLDSHVRYARTGRRRYLAAAAGWLLFGLIFDEKSVVIPFLIFAVTAGFLVRRPLRDSIWLTLSRLWKAWVAYLVLLAGYAVVLVGAIRAAKIKSTPSSLHAALTFTSGLLRETFLPSLLGGPWKWFPINEGATVAWAPPSGLIVGSILLAAAIIVGSILFRRKAWRAWAILAGWIVFADVLPLVLGRLGYPAADSFLDLESRYVVDASAVLAICIALAFWPVAEPQEQTAAGRRRRREFFTGHWQTAGIGLTVVFVVGSLVSASSMESASSGEPVRSYLATAQAAMAGVPSGTVIYGGGDVSPALETGLFGKYANVSEVVRPLSHRGSQLTWVTRPYGTIDNLMAFTGTGQLVPAVILPLYATASGPLASDQICNSPASGRFVYHFPSSTSGWTVALQIGYDAGPTQTGRSMTVIYGNVVRHVRIESGLHTAWVPVTGVVSAVVIDVAGAPSAGKALKAGKSHSAKSRAASHPRSDFCVAPTVTAGDIGAGAAGTAYPAAPVAGG